MPTSASQYQGCEVYMMYKGGRKLTFKAMNVNIKSIGREIWQTFKAMNVNIKSKLEEKYRKHFGV